jgi:hypothetical protein
MRTCAYCGTEGHRSIRCRFGRRTDWLPVAVYLAWGVVGIVLAATLSGCSLTVAPDTLCQGPRPSARTNDTAGTRMALAEGAKLWEPVHRAGVGDAMMQVLGLVPILASLALLAAVGLSAAALVAGDGDER